MMQQLVRSALQQLGVERVRNALPALATVGEARDFRSCFLCYALHGRAAETSEERHQAGQLALNLPLGWVLSGLHYTGDAEQAQMLRDEVILFLAEHGDAPEPHIAPESAHAI